jgi:uncharacterized protein
MHPKHEALLALQELDDEIARAEARLAEFDPQVREVSAPLTALSAEVETARTKLADLRAQVERLESAGEQKRERLKQYEERLRMRNTREEAAARVELDLVRRAVQADEREAAENKEQATRTDLKLDDLIRQLEKKRAELAPALEEIEARRAEVEAELNKLRARRSEATGRLDPQALRLYERIRSGLSKRVLAPLTDEGACGYCFNLLPVQEQSQIRGSDTLHRCEACGIILYAA